jgi:hypothetical protein
MANDTLRQRILTAGGPRMLSAVARHRGFPSAAALEAALQLGAKLAQGGAITSADVQGFARHYPALPRETFARYASRINAAEPGRARRDAMVRALGFGTALDAAAREIDSYATAEVAQAVNARMDERHRAPAPEPDRNHPTWRHNDDAAGRRATLAAQFAEPLEFKPGSDYASVRRQLADRMDEQDMIYSATKAASSRRDDIAYAFDVSSNKEQAESIMDVEDLVEPLSEATSAGETHHE